MLVKLICFAVKDLPFIQALFMIEEIFTQIMDLKLELHGLH